MSAGLIGIADVWEGFKDRWEAILRKHGVIPPFHMTDFEAKKDQFKGWDENTQRRPLMKALMDEICARRIFLFGAAVSVEWFRSFDWSGGFPDSEPLADPYYLAMQDVIREGIRVCNTGTSSLTNESKLAVIMGKQKEFQGVAAAYYRAAARFDSTSTLLNVATFVEPVDYPQLQAADIAAFELRWRITRPDICRYPWKRMSEGRANNIFLRGIDSANVFPELTYQPTDDNSLILMERNQKRKRNQSKKSRF